MEYYIRTAIVLTKNNVEYVVIIDITRNIYEYLLDQRGIVLTPGTDQLYERREVQIF